MRIMKIRSEEDYRAALEEIERLMLGNPALDSEEADRLEILSLLVDEYEKAHGDWRAALRDAEDGAARKALRDNPPIADFWPRFEEWCDTRPATPEL